MCVDTAIYSAYAPKVGFSPPLVALLETPSRTSVSQTKDLVINVESTLWSLAETFDNP